MSSAEAVFDVRRRQLFRQKNHNFKMLSEAGEIFRPAIIRSAFAFVLVHNHPSGDTDHSKADLQLLPSLSTVAGSSATLGGLR